MQKYLALLATFCLTGLMVATLHAAPLLTRAEQQETDPNTQLYLSSGNNGTVGGVAFQDEDILFFDGQNWSLFLDMSDVGIKRDVAAFSVLEENAVLLSVNDNTNFPGVGSITPNDIVLFTPTSIGEETAGTFSLFLKGSDVGLDTPNESIDAISIAGDGRLLISTKGKAIVGQMAAGDEDIIAFSGIAFGSPTVGEWTMYFDGSDVGLSKSSEDVVGASVNPMNGQLLLTTKGAFEVGDLVGDAKDVIIFSSTSLGFATGGTFQPEPYFSGATLTDDIGPIDGLTIHPQSLPEQTPNSLASPGKIVIKNKLISGIVNGAGNAHVVFNFHGDVQDFTIYGQSQRTIPDLNPGTYQISILNPPPGWSLYDISCTDPDNGSSHIGKLAIIDLDAGETVTCTFVNEESGGFMPENEAHDTIYITTKGNGKLSEQSFNKMDILAYDPSINQWSIYFSGLEVGIVENLNGIHVVPDSHILMSFDKAQILQGVAGVIQPWDIVTYSLTRGVFSRYFKGSDAGLLDEKAAIDAFSLTSDDDLVISTRGTAVLNDGTLVAKDEDLLLWNAELGIWQIYIDSSLSGFAADTTALSINGQQDSQLYLTSDKNFILDDSSGDASDIFIMNVTSHNALTHGIFGPGIFFDGSALGLDKEIIDGVSIYSP